MPFNLSNLNRLRIAGLTFGSCTSEMEERPHPYRWLEDAASNGRFRLLRIDRGTQQTVGDAALNRLKDALERDGVCYRDDVDGIAAIAAGAIDLFMRAWSEQLEFDRIDGRGVMVVLDDVDSAATPTAESFVPAHTPTYEPVPLRVTENVPVSLQDWLRTVFAPNDSHIDLFNTEDADRCVVASVNHGGRNVQVLQRHHHMTNRIRQLAGIVENSHGHCGVLYCMYRLDANRHIVPRYFGIANWRRKDCGGVSANYDGVSNGGGNSHFVRWGYGDYWHIGRLSNALLRGNPAYANWTHDLFHCQSSLPSASPLRLREPVYWAGVPWPCPSGILANGEASTGTPPCVDWMGQARTLEEMEKLLIASCPDLLNKRKGKSGCSRARCGHEVPYPCPQA